jgi:hypothetical protein
MKTNWILEGEHGRVADHENLRFCLLQVEDLDFGNCWQQIVSVRLDSPRKPAYWGMAKQEVDIFLQHRRIIDPLQTARLICLEVAC